jgi:hypothetical protein
MTYIILRDTFGAGLTTFESTKLEVFSEKYLPEAVVSVGQELMDEAGIDTVNEYEENLGRHLAISDEIVICEIVDEVDKMSADDYIRHHIVEAKIKQSTDEYGLYLKLKKKFEND